MTCPHCGNIKTYAFKSGKRHRCASCKKDFTAKTGTAFAQSNLSPDKLRAALLLFQETDGKISSCELSRRINITQKSAFHLKKKISAEVCIPA